MERKEVEELKYEILYLEGFLRWLGLKQSKDGKKNEDREYIYKIIHDKRQELKRIEK